MLDTSGKAPHALRESGSFRFVTGERPRRRRSRGCFAARRRSPRPARPRFLITANPGDSWGRARPNWGCWIRCGQFAWVECFERALLRPPPDADRALRVRRRQAPRSRRAGGRGRPAALRRRRAPDRAHPQARRVGVLKREVGAEDEVFETTDVPSTSTSSEQSPQSVTPRRAAPRRCRSVQAPPSRRATATASRSSMYVSTPAQARARRAPVDTESLVARAGGLLARGAVPSRCRSSPRARPQGSAGLACAFGWPRPRGGGRGAGRRLAARHLRGGVVRVDRSVGAFDALWRVMRLRGGERRRPPASATTSWSTTRASPSTPPTRKRRCAD